LMLGGARLCEPQKLVTQIVNIAELHSASAQIAIPLTSFGGPAE
jgi:hypothetical protein